MLPRTLEPELMDTADDAREYDAMDHAAVNEIFVTDLLRSLAEASLERPALNLLDLGAGTAQIPIELAHRAANVHITAVDAAVSMLVTAQQNIAAAHLVERITCVHADAKSLPFDASTFDATISNSILHHIPNPREVLAEAIRVTAPGGLLFHRDLCRPPNQLELSRIVGTYAADANAYQRKLFADSLHAALTLDEMQQLVTSFGFAPQTVQMTSDRHWTWTARRPGSASK